MLIQTFFRKNAWFGALRQSQAGNVAIEFGLTAIVFFSVIVALFDVAAVSLAETLLGRGIATVSREAQLGQFTNANNGAALFRSRLCEETLGLFDCEDFHIVVQPSTSFGSASAMTNINPATQFAEAERFQFGGPEDIVLFRVIYPWRPLIMDPRLAGRVDLDGNSLLISTAVTRNEPA